jgi:hypothetical protein
LLDREAILEPSHPQPGLPHIYLVEPERFAAAFISSRGGCCKRLFEESAFDGRGKRPELCHLLDHSAPATSWGLQVGPAVAAVAGPANQNANGGTGFSSERIVDDGVLFLEPASADDRQEHLFVETVRLSQYHEEDQRGWRWLLLAH